MALRKRPRSESTEPPAAAAAAKPHSEATSKSCFADIHLQVRTVDGTPVGHSLALPAFGLGTFRLKGPACRRAVEHAVRRGCRHIDTASSYNNESDVAAGIKAALSDIGGAKQQRVVITTKVPRGVMGKPADVIKASVEASRAALKGNGGPPLDILLLHWPGTDNSNVASPLHRRARIAAWKVLEGLQASGDIVRIIGVSNFSVEHLQQLVEDGASMLPAINQVEMHPYLQQRALRAFCAAKKIHVQGYSSMGRCDEPPRCLYGHYEPSHPKLVSDALVSAVAARNKLSPPQVLLLYSLQHGLSVIPKSQKTEHFDENFSAFAAGTFALCAADMALLDDIPRPAAEPFAYAYPLCKFPN